MAEETPTEPEIGVTRQPAGGVQVSAGIMYKEIAARGKYDDLETVAYAIKVGTRCQIPFYGDSGSYYAIAACSLAKIRGGLGEIRVRVATAVKVSFWSLDHQEIQKPVINWHADRTGTEKPDVSQILQWQALKDKDYTAYTQYKYKSDSDGTTYLMTNATLTLAQMMFSGIEYYSLYQPVCVRTSRYNSVPSDAGQNLGKIIAPAEPEGWVGASADESLSGTDPVTTISALATQWLKTSDRTTPNADGTFSRVEQWVGADAWNPNLYQEVAS